MPAEAACAGLRRARPASEAAACLLLFSDTAGALRAAERADGEDGDLEPLAAAAFAASLDGDPAPAVACLGRIDLACSGGRMSSDEAALLREIAAAALEYNERGAVPVYGDRRTSAALNRVVLGDLSSGDVAPGRLLLEFPTLTALALARAAAPRDAVESLAASDSVECRRIGEAAARVLLGTRTLARVPAESDVDLWLRCLELMIDGSAALALSLLEDWRSRSTSPAARAAAAELGGLLGQPAAALRDLGDPTWALEIGSRLDAAPPDALDRWRVIGAATRWAAAHDPPAGAIASRATALLALGRTSDAVEHVVDSTHAAKTEEGRAMTLVIAARAAASEVGGAARAAAFAQSAAVLAPRNALALATVAELEIERSDADAARSALLLLFSDRAAPPPLADELELLRIASDAVARSASDNDAAVAFLTSVAEARASDTAPWVALGDLFERLGRWDAAATALEDAARTASDASVRAALYRRVGDIYLDHRQLRLPALENYLISFMCDRGAAAVLERLDALYRALDRPKDLLGAYTIAARFADASPELADLPADELLRRRAEIEISPIGRPDLAARSACDALRRAPARLDVATLLLDVLEQNPVATADALPEAVVALETAIGLQQEPSPGLDAFAARCRALVGRAAE
ncbi:MAG: hypothetical protein H6699_06365 [Myxococcales bacterium]|nr:hypothetical protein [Myxococcales bacterium]